MLIIIDDQPLIKLKLDQARLEVIEIGATSQRQVRMSVCQQIIQENEDSKSMPEIKEMVERKLMDWGYAWHTRRDYLRVLRLIS